MFLKNPTRNLIGSADSLRSKNSNGVVLSPETYTHTWTASNAVVSVVSEKYVHPVQYSLKIQPLNPALPIVLTLPSVVPDDTESNGAEVQFHCDTAITAVAEIQNVTQSTSTSHQQLLTSGRWNAVWSPVIDVGVINTSVDDIEFAIEITLTNHGGLVCYLSVPYIVNELGIYKNSFVYNMRKFMPTFIWDRDKIQEYPNYPMTKLLHSMTVFAHFSALLYTRYFEYLNGQISIDKSNETFRYSQLVNPIYVDDEYTPWLTQFNGTPIYKSIQTQSATEAITNQSESIEWQLVNAYFGRNAGTTEAIRECAKQVLTGSKVCYIVPGGSFFQINIYTVISETPGVTSEGDESPEVLAITEKTRPMGFVILDDPTYGVLNVAPLA
jgi:hypothetical protein